MLDSIKPRVIAEAPISFIAPRTVARGKGYPC